MLDNFPPIPGHALFPNGADPSHPGAYDVFKGRDYAPDRINDAALDFVRKNASRPFFLYYPTILPHLALHVPDRYLEPYLNLGWVDAPFTNKDGRGFTPHFTPKAAYAAMITRMDFYLGQLMTLLDELELREKTVIIFTSDNGPTNSENEVDTDFFSSVGTFRGRKGSLYEGGVRVPAIVRWPGKVQAGSTTDYVSGLEDWFPTIFELASSEDASHLDVDGVSLVRLILGHEVGSRDFLYREFPSNQGWQFVRVGKWKAIRPKLRAGSLKVELYDLDVDPNERFDVASQHPEVTKELTELLGREHSASETFPLPSIDTSPYTEMAKDRLRSAYIYLRSLGRN